MRYSLTSKSLDSYSCDKHLFVQILYALRNLQVALIFDVVFTLCLFILFKEDS